MRRIVVTVVIALGWLVALAAPASAHTVSGVSATDYRTRLKAVQPAVPGVSLRVVETGSRIELSNTTNTEVLVLGYQDEPYLRVGPNGVYQNLRSPATYLNATRKGAATIPGSADPTQPPQWKKVSDAHVARWHDHRVHFMGTKDPPVVRRAAGQEHVIVPEWVITMKHGSTTIKATGDLTYVPGPKPLPWFGLALVLFAGVVGIVFTKAWARLLALVTVLVVAADAIHAFGIGFDKAGTTGTKLGAVAAGSFYSVLAWIVGGIGAYLLARRRPEGLFAAAFAGVFVALFGGVSDINDLFKSQVPFAWGASLPRLLVAVSLGGGLGLVAAAILGLRRNPVTPEVDEDEGAGDDDDAAETAPAPA